MFERFINASIFTPSARIERDSPQWAQARLAIFVPLLVLTFYFVPEFFLIAQEEHIGEAFNLQLKDMTHRLLG